METTSNLTYAILLTLGAGLATGVGSLIAFFAKTTNRRFLSFSLGLSAGIMIYISFMELLFQARVDLTALTDSARTSDIITTALFFGGMLLAGLIDKLVPEMENPHELHSIEELTTPDQHHARQLERVGIVTALAVTIHNFPEGIATFMTAMHSPSMGIGIAAAVAIHNIPEGIAVSVPIYYATHSKRKALWLSSLSGLAEPLGAIVAYLILLPFLSPMLLSCTFAAVAGIMIYIAFDGLLPAAHQYGENHIEIYGLILGMVIMAVSLIALG